MLRVNFTIPEKLYADFQTRCKAAGMPMSTVVQDIMRHFLAKPFEKPAKMPDHDRKIQNALNAQARAKRNDDIVRRVGAGERPARLAAEYGMTASGISHVLARAGKRGKSQECHTPSPPPPT